MPIVQYVLGDFSPDSKAQTPGSITTNAVIPTPRGIANGISASSTWKTVAASAACGMFQGYGLDGSTLRKFVATGPGIYESGAAWGSVGGATYNATTSDTWSFGMFGDAALAVNKNDVVQASTSVAATFAAISGAPKASILITPGSPNGQFAMVFDYNDGTNNYPDGVWWSALGDYTSWTASISTEAGNVRVTDINGPWTAAVPYRDGVVAFKQNAVYVGTYVGGAAVWSWQRVASGIGCLGKNACCVAYDTVYFVDRHGLWMFDGSYPQMMPGELANWWQSEITTSSFFGDISYAPQSNFVRMTLDPTNKNIWIGYGGPQGLALWLVFNLLSKHWTVHGILYDKAQANSVNDMVDYTFLTARNAWANTISSAVADIPAGLVALAPFGDPYDITTIRSARIVAESQSTTAAWVGADVIVAASLLGAAVTTQAMTYTSPNRLDLMVNGRYLQPRFSMHAGVSWEISSISFDMVSGGKE